MNYCIAPKSWDPEDINPFQPSGSYEGYSALFFQDIDDHNYMNGTSKSGLFNVKFHNNAPERKQRVHDFIQYESLFKRKVILGADHKIDFEKLLDKTDIYDDWYQIRDSDPEVLVHSTNLTAWRSIQSDMKLKSSLLLLNEGIEHISVGFEELKEPEEYKDFVMFGTLGFFPEFIVQSQQKGKIHTKEDEEYTPGVRIYLDCHKMIKDRIIFRDGLHLVKVKGYVDIKKYHLFSCSVDDIESGSDKSWTPRIFAEASDLLYEEFTQKNINT